MRQRQIPSGSVCDQMEHTFPPDRSTLEAPAADNSPGGGTDICCGAFVHHSRLRVKGTKASPSRQAQSDCEQDADESTFSLEFRQISTVQALGPAARIASVISYFVSFSRNMAASFFACTSSVSPSAQVLRG